MPWPEDLLAQRRLFIFDLDGTLADSSPIHAAAFATAFAGHDVAIDYSTIAGLTSEAAVAALLDRSGLALDAAARNDLVAAKRAAARDGLSEVREIAGARDFVDRAVAGGRRVALCTSGSAATVAATLAAIGLGDRFDPVVTANDVAAAKPDPAGFRRVLDLAGSSPDEAVVFEDSDAGLAAAAAAGIAAIRIGHGHADWATLTRALA